MPAQTKAKKGAKTGRQPIRKGLTEAQVAREAAGMDRKALARRCGMSEDYLRNIERAGCGCLVTAEMLARIVGCRVEVYLGPRIVPKATHQQTLRLHPPRVEMRTQTTTKPKQSKAPALHQ